MWLVRTARTAWQLLVLVKDVAVVGLMLGCARLLSEAGRAEFQDAATRSALLRWRTAQPWAGDR